MARAATAVIVVALRSLDVAAAAPTLLHGAGEHIQADLAELAELLSASRTPVYWTALRGAS